MPLQRDVISRAIVFKKARSVRDMQFVKTLFENAHRILATAVEAENAGLGANDWTIFVGPEGGMEMIAGTEHSLESLRWTHGAQASWQVTRAEGVVRVEGRSLRERCSIESDSNARVARMLLGAPCRYANA